MQELVVESLVVSLAMVVFYVLVDETTQMPLAERDHACETLLFDRPDEPLGIGVEIGTLRRQPNRLNTGALQDLAKDPRIEGIAVVNQMARPAQTAIDRVGQIAGLLLHPRAARLRVDPGDGHAAGSQLDHEEDEVPPATVTIGEGSAFVFVAVDHCTTECIGLHAAKSGSRFEALEPIRQGVRERFGAIGKGVAHGLRLRHDHGSNYLADDFQQEVAFFGIESSPSFVREPEGNGVAERFIRTLKENLLWVRSFDTLEELRLALLEFKRTYNEHWMLERYDYRSPAQVRRDLVGLDAAA